MNKRKFTLFQPENCYIWIIFHFSEYFILLKEMIKNHSPDFLLKHEMVPMVSSECTVFSTLISIRYKHFQYCLNMYGLYVQNVYICDMNR
jgi:hypothetical protein